MITLTSVFAILALYFALRAFFLFIFFRTAKEATERDAMEFLFSLTLMIVLSLAYFVSL